MIKEDLVFVLTDNEKYSSKLTNNDSYDLVSNQALNEEIQTLCDKDILHNAIKINDIPHGKTIYLFKANVDDADYNNHPVSSVKIIVNKEAVEINKKNLKFLDKYISTTEKLNVYATCQKIFTTEMINDTVIEGYSIGTYSSSKHTKEFVLNESIKEENKNWNNYVIYDDYQQYEEENNSKLEESYALKG